MRRGVWMIGAVAISCSGGAPPAAVNGCTTFSDMTAGGGTITFPSQAAPAQYQPPCARIKVHQALAWSGSFASHPLQPMGGDAPNPIQPTSTGTTASFTFDTAGTFGFGCGLHASMSGAVLVEP